ncbi:MAG: hypothetical protein LC620_01460 [Halobacteriales archaeon]|nr:hypothetical protein [Halobacteriales archaeon]
MQKVGVAAILALVLILAALPAQASLTLQVEEPHALASPAAPILAVNVTVTLDCAALLARSGAMVQSQQVPVSITTSSGRSDVFASGPGQIDIDPHGCGRVPAPTNVTASGHATYGLAVAYEVPALVPQPIAFAASLPTSGALAAESANATIHPAVTPLPFIHVGSAVPLVHVNGTEAKVLLDMQSLGNVGIQIDASASYRGDYTAAGSVDLPALRLGNRAVGEAYAAVWTVTFHAPQSAWTSHYVFLNVTPVALGPIPTRGVTQQVTLLFIHEQPQTQSSPGGAGLAALGVLLAAAFVMRRRHGHMNRNP